MVPGWVGVFVRFSKTPVRFKVVVEPLLLEFDELPPEKLGEGLHPPVPDTLHETLFAV
jgi:hypothetical protein